MTLHVIRQFIWKLKDIHKRKYLHEPAQDARHSDFWEFTSRDTAILQFQIITYLMNIINNS